MASCVSLSPVISKAPIITSSPLKKPHYASKIALLEQLQRRHRNYKIKRQLASETTSTIKIEGREEILDSIDNFSSYTLDMGMFTVCFQLPIQFMGHDEPDHYVITLSCMTYII